MAYLVASMLALRHQECIHGVRCCQMCCICVHLSLESVSELVGLSFDGEFLWELHKLQKNFKTWTLKNTTLCKTCFWHKPWLFGALRMSICTPGRSKRVFKTTWRCDGPGRFHPDKTPEYSIQLILISFCWLIASNENKVDLKAIWI